MRIDQREEDRAPAVAARTAREAPADPAGRVLSLQRAAGNAAVSALLGGPGRAAAPVRRGAPAQDAAVASSLARAALTRAPAAAQEELKRYDFEVGLYDKPMHFRGLTSAQALEKLRLVWRLAHQELDEGRAEHLRLQENREEHWVAGFWSDVFGGVELPDPDMWNEVGRGPLAQVRDVLDAAEAGVKATWERNEASIDRGLDPAVAGLPLMREALAFDATQERITAATRLLDRAAGDLRDCHRRLDEYAEGTAKGAARAITGIKVTIVVLSAAAGGAGAGFAGEGAGIVAQAGASAGTLGALGASEELFTQIGQMRIGEREAFDFARIAKRGVKDVVAGFVGGVVGGKFASVVRDRVGGWVAGVSEEALAAYGITRQELLTNGERLFIDWVAGNVAASPFTTTARTLMDRALEGRWKVQTFGDFTGLVFDDMVTSGAMGGFLSFAGRASGHAEAPVIEESPPGGFEPEGPEPPGEDYGPEPPQEELDPEKIGEVESDGVPEPIHDEPATEPHSARTPRPETRIKDDRTRAGSVEEVRRRAADLLAAHRAAAERAAAGGGPRAVDELIAHIRGSDPGFADEVQLYFEKVEDPQFLVEQMGVLWEQAAAHDRTVADELEHSLGGPSPELNEFRNTPGLTPEQAAEEFRAVVADPRTLIDLSNAGDHHGSHTHAFHQFLGDRIFGPGGGLRFRQRLAALQGPPVIVRPGPDQFARPFWARLWNELFDAFDDGLHAPEVLGRILQDVLDFPRWDP